MSSMHDSIAYNQILPIKFRPLPEEFQYEEQKVKKVKGRTKIDSKLEKILSQQQQDSQWCKFNDSKFKHRHPIEANFSFEHSFPAVIFDEVCFSVDKSQQQANFLDECLFRLKTCFDFSSQFSSPTSNRVEILKSINLNVPSGSIFGLLGPSSCGKTTLLRCLVGLLKQNSGSIRLFGHTDDVSSASRSKRGCCLNCFNHDESLGNHRKRCKVPGANVGYMPQDLGLYEDFTIDQLLTMFGRYMGMPEAQIGERIGFMVNFLDLPKVNRQISSLSGGQKRRVSFAVACLHMPPLIILDEPTVGVDPLLRKSIWKYLRRLADEENRTIIITTHYIEEAAQADQVALMRAGEILIQDKPRNIMQLNGCKTLEEAFLKICNNVSNNGGSGKDGSGIKFSARQGFNWHEKLQEQSQVKSRNQSNENKLIIDAKPEVEGAKDRNVLEKHELLIEQLKLKAQEKLKLFDQLHSEKRIERQLEESRFSPTNVPLKLNQADASTRTACDEFDPASAGKRIKFGRGHKLFVARSNDNCLASQQYEMPKKLMQEEEEIKSSSNGLFRKVEKSFKLSYALLYKNYRRNVNSLPLLAFQFLLPIVQMISFSLCVGGKPSNIGLGLVNLDQPLFVNSSTGEQLLNVESLHNETGNKFDYETILLSDNYLNLLDKSILNIRSYENRRAALNDVRQAKLWAVMEIGENFTQSILKRFDLDNFYQLTPEVIKQSVIRLYPDRSNKVLDMICHRSLANSYRSFLSEQFDHFKRLPIEMKEPIFDIKPNLISNSIDGYTESIAAGLLASLTYIMAAGLTTFIMVVERSNGILERTYTSGINPIAYLLAHAAFRSLVMMLQIALVMLLTFQVLKQPLVGSIWLAYFMLMTLNLTGISYGLLISSLVTDQNGAALTIVSSLVIKITLSGILWPFEAIPRWLRLICYCQPLTMPIQALKSITLKGATFQDRTVYLGFLVSLGYLLLFLTIAARRFKFYQH